MARSENTPKNASFSAPSKAPVDIKYRSERATTSMMDALMYINAIDPSTLPDGVHAAALAAIANLGEALGQVELHRPRTKTEVKEGIKVAPAPVAPAPPAAVEVAQEEPSPEEQLRRMGEAIRDAAAEEELGSTGSLPLPSAAVGLSLSLEIITRPGVSSKMGAP